ncbi:hypothetical protein BDV24DRAFT_132237 [Aspergillus arachidicola]|uniref:Uncharacterized protein n=1 Tax=Aspergillus arachidicola TaxID=656916 RepID=A0A5N6Y7V6_9EURO|nr:hypothetical protein BDV24DRAFT_132237 [Aspergillus arachidicola]
MSLNVALCSIRPVLSSRTTVRRRHLMGIAMAYDSNSNLERLLASNSWNGTTAVCVCSKYSPRRMRRGRPNVW